MKIDLIIDVKIKSMRIGGAKRRGERLNLGGTKRRHETMTGMVIDDDGLVIRRNEAFIAKSRVLKVQHAPLLLAKSLRALSLLPR